MHKPNLHLKYQRGFSLIEMAVVLVILGFVISALLLPLQGQREIGHRTQTENQLELARKALIGFAQANGRLPCPAIATSGGLEHPLAPDTGRFACTQQLGFLPAATLGIQPSTNGFALDAWNNRIMYAVSQSNAGGALTPDFTSLINDDPATPAVNEADGMNVVGISALAPELRICNSALGITTTTCSLGSPEVNYAANNAVAVLYSYGPTGSLLPGGLDEGANFHADPDNPTDPHSVFVSRGVTGATATTEEFDHIVTWISPYVLYNAMITAGQLR